MHCRFRNPALALVISLLAMSHAFAQDKIAWRSDYQTARKESQDKNKPLVIDFFTDPCPWCVKMDTTTYADPAVIALLNEKFVALKVNGSVEPKLAAALQIASYPTTVFASPDGKIIGNPAVGYRDPAVFLELLQRIGASQSAPDWMLRDLNLAQKWVVQGEYGRAIYALKSIVEEGKGRPAATEAYKLLQLVEGKAAERLAKARELQEKGQGPEAVAFLTETIGMFPGIQASREASEMLTAFAKAQAVNVQTAEQKNAARLKRAGELIAQARDFYKGKEYLLCLDRCELLVAGYSDLNEGQDAFVLISEIRSNPEWMQAAADTLSDRLGGVYLALADTLLKKGQPQRAEFYLQRVVQSFPGTRQAESAQIRLAQLQGLPARRVDIQAASRPE
jgi:thioredoxin-related protein